MKEWKRIESTQTMGEFVDQTNNNAESGEFLDDVVGKMLYNGVFFNGLETVNKKEIVPLESIDLSDTTTNEVLLDNFKLYFKEGNEVVEMNLRTIDLSNPDYNTNEPLFLYVKKDLSYRVSNYMFGSSDEILLARFVINDNKFVQFYIVAQRAGTNAYNAAEEFYEVDGLSVETPGGLGLSLSEGVIKRSGIDFTDKYSPDIYTFNYNASLEKPIRYVTNENRVSYLDNTSNVIIPNKKLDYNSHSLTNVGADAWTIQRVLFDPYEECLILQYGDTEYATFEAAAAATSYVSYPAPFGKTMYIPLAVLVVKQSATDLSNGDQARIVVRKEIDVDSPINGIEDLVAQAKAENALSQIAEALKEIEALETSLANETSERTSADTNLQSKITSAVNAIDALEDVVESNRQTAAAHAARTDNPHSVTKSQVGLGNVDNTSDANKPLSAAAIAEFAKVVYAVAGKGLSTNDFTKEFMDAVQELIDGGGADNYSKSGHTHDDRYYTETEADGRYVRNNNTGTEYNINTNTFMIDGHRVWVGYSAPSNPTTNDVWIDLNGG